VVSLLVVVAMPARSAHAVDIGPVDLGLAAPFAILAADSVGNTLTGPVTTVRGDLGVLAAAGAVTGFGPGVVDGTLFAPGAAPVVAAHADLVDAYANAAGRSSDFVLAGDLIGLTLHPGVHTNGAAIANTGTVTLDGDDDPNAVFIFQVGGALNIAAASSVALTDGTQAKNVFWQVNGAATIAANSQFSGTLMTAAAISVGANSTFNGRALAKTGAITTNSNQFYSNPPAVTINGGSTVSVSDDTPTISGTSDVDVPATVTVTIGAQVLSAPVQVNGSWSVTAASIANGVYPVQAAAVDAVGNTGTDTQSLAIDTVLPVVAITGGATRLTTDSTPTIDGSSDVAPGTLVTLTIAGQTWNALVQSGGSWNVTSTALAMGSHTLTASVTDPAGNVSTATQTLTVTSTLAVAPVGPKRVFDTRIGQSASLLRTVAKTKVGGAYELEVHLTDLGGYVPATGVGAVSLNVTVTNPEASGFVTVYACGTREAVSSVNYVAGQTVANAVISPVSATGTVCFYSSAPTDIVVDINGWLPEGQAFTPVGPKRVFDTRLGVSGQALRAVAKNPVPTGEMIEVLVTDLAGLVPASGVDSVSLNVTVTNPTAYGFITVYACGTREAVSSVNYVAGQTVANAVIAPISPSGTVCFYAESATDLVVDINGWFKLSAGFTGVSPKRVLDTRAGTPDALRTVAKNKIGNGYILEVRVTDLGDTVPESGVAVVSLNVTATNADGDGFVTVYGCGTREEVSSLNYTTGLAVANAVLAPVSAAGTICLFAFAPTDVIVDINGWFASTS
jgi:hypothetical protein